MVDIKKCLVLAGFVKCDVPTSPVLVWVGFGYEVKDAAARRSD